jgi:hypothetical protein
MLNIILLKLCLTKKDTLIRVLRFRVGSEPTLMEPITELHCNLKQFIFSITYTWDQ